MQAFIDNLIRHVDPALRSIFAHDTASQHPYPAAGLAETNLSDQEKRHSAALMRINHCGEICAQALYQGQAITAHDPKTRDMLTAAANEEQDHLAWCQQRLNELNAHTSTLNPILYAGSFSLGCLAGLIGDQWSLGFINETEQQVTKHLDSHLESITSNDQKSRVIIAQMRADEQQHANTAVSAGARELPGVVKSMMRCSAKVMTTLAYYI
jgi:3-demethoxyubiquinol 3-hydroxylase